MYNEERKQRYFADLVKYEATKNIEVAFFEKVAPFEERFQKDISEFSVEELKEATESAFEKSYNTNKRYMLILKKYVEWCIDNNYPGACRSVQHIEPQSIDKVRMNMVANPMQLQMYMDVVFDPIEEETIHIVYRCFLWMAFMGIQKEDSIAVTPDNVDFENMTISYAYKNHSIPNEAILVFRKAVNLKQFFHKHGIYDKYMDRVNDRPILRGIKASVTGDTMAREISRILNAAFESGKTDRLLSYQRIWLSGQFARRLEAERAGIPPRFEDLVEECAPSLPEKSKQRKARTLGKDYEAWKTAFSV